MCVKETINSTSLQMRWCAVHDGNILEIHQTAIGHATYDERPNGFQHGEELGNELRMLSTSWRPGKWHALKASMKRDQPGSNKKKR